MSAAAKTAERANLARACRRAHPGRPGRLFELLVRRYSISFMSHIHTSP